jgi:hypothetical protein
MDAMRHGAIPATTAEVGSHVRPLSERYCPWCRARHGFGHCGHASWLTQVALSRRGAPFNWR